MRDSPAAFDEALLRELPAGVDPCGERGEFHLRLLGPDVRPARRCRTGRDRVRDGRFAYTDFTLPL